MSEVITISTTDYIIYGSVAGAKAYFAGSYLNSDTWSALSSAEQKQSLIQATRIFERTTWDGSPTDPIDKSNLASQPANTQPLQWPRSGLVDRNGVSIGSDTTPLDVDYGCYELAVNLTANALVSSQDRQVKAESSTEKVGELEVTTSNEYFAATSRGQGRFTPAVDEYISIWLSANQVLDLGCATGTAYDESIFTNADGAWGLTDTGLN